MHKRLFFALWPNDDTRRQCHGLATRLRDHGQVVPAANLHVTLVFLGSTTVCQQQALSQVAASLTLETMTLVFDRLTYWKKPAVACLTASQGDSRLLPIVDALSQAAIDSGMTIDTRPYTPHVTLLRKARPVFPLLFEPVVWCSDEVCLVESVTTPDGVCYQVIGRWRGC